jgi:hypothetical protein
MMPPIMTTEDIKQELDREPFIPLRLHLSSGQKIDIQYAGTAWVRQNTLLVVHPIAPRTSQIGKYDVIALRLIERIEQVQGNGKASGRRKKSG